MGAAHLLNDLLSRGLILIADGDKLRVRGKLTDEDRAAIRQHKPELLALLAATAVPAPRSESRPAPSIPPAAQFVYVACSACVHPNGGRCTKRGFHPVFPHITMRLCSDYAEPKPAAIEGELLPKASRREALQRIVRQADELLRNEESGR